MGFGLVVLGTQLVKHLVSTSLYNQSQGTREHIPGLQVN